MTARVVAGRVFAQRYRLDAQLGAGGMGEVWHATDLQLGRAVAVKVLLPRLVAKGDGRARFEREARVGATLAHANVIHTLDFGVDGDTCYLVLELVGGGSVFDRMVARRGPLPLREVIAIGYQVADALAAAHALGVVHRDLKPENVLVERTPGDELRVKVADFGMAFLVAPDDPRSGRLTHDGSGAGTPEYMAPEQAGAGEVGPSVDVYALGCMLFELATGAPPFQGPVGKVIAAHLYAPVPRLRDRHADALPGLEDLIARMLAKRADERPTAEAVRRRLAMIGGDWLEPSARARDGVVVSDRASRMLPTTPPPIAAAAARPAIAIAVEGEALDAEQVTALAAAGYGVLDAVDPSARIGAIVMFGLAALEAVAARCAATRVPVLADAERADFRRIAELLRAGAADVVLRPIQPATLVRKLDKLALRPEVP